MINRKCLLALVFVVVSFVSLFPGANGISIPFFGSFGSSSSNRQQTPTLLYNKEQKDARIINADHGVSGNGGAQSPSSSSATASLAGGSFLGHSPWISDQLVVIHPDSPINRGAWKESGYLDPESEKEFRFGLPNNNGGIMVPSARTPPSRLRKPTRKSKQQMEPTKIGSGSEQSTSANQNPNNAVPPPPQGNNGGGLYEFLPTPLTYQDYNLNSDLTSNQDDLSMINHDAILFPANNYLLPFSAPIFPYSPRTYASHSTLPPEAIIQLLKSPEQELNPNTRPQVKLPFPLSHDCSANIGGSSGKPLQFVVLPIVEPVAPLKPIFPKPSFLSSQYGQFPYIPPFNYFNKKPPVFPNSNYDGSVTNGGNQPGGGGQSSGQFVPILNRPAPPLPFVFVQSLPLELIGQNMEMDVLNSSPSQTSQINEVSPIVAPPTSPQPLNIQQQQQVSSSVYGGENVITSATRPLPLIVIEKVKTPGQPPSSPVAPATAVVEISKQSLPKSGGTGSGNSSPLSSISVIKPITAPGSAPPTPQQQHEIHKAIEKLVPVAAAVLENVEQQQQKQQKDDKNQEPVTTVSPSITSSEQVAVTTTAVAPVNVSVKENEQEKSSLRPPLRPNPEPLTSASEETAGIAVNPTTMTEVEITEA